MDLKHLDPVSAQSNKKKYWGRGNVLIRTQKQIKIAIEKNRKNARALFEKEIRKALRNR